LRGTRIVISYVQKAINENRIAENQIANIRALKYEHVFVTSVVYTNTILEIKI